MKQSLDSKLSSEELQTGAITVGGHRALDYPEWGQVSTSTAILSSTHQLVQERGSSADTIKRHKLYVSRQLEKLDNLDF